LEFWWSSGVNNTSTDLSPFHDFSIDGKYTVLAIVTGKDGTVEVLTGDAKELKSLRNQQYLCMWRWFDSWFSKSFDTSIVQQVLGGQTDKVVIFIDGKGNKYIITKSFYQ
jgi:hypothetical protein